MRRTDTRGARRGGHSEEDTRGAREEDTRGDREKERARGGHKERARGGHKGERGGHKEREEDTRRESGRRAKDRRRNKQGKTWKNKDNKEKQRNRGLKGYLPRRLQELAKKTDFEHPRAFRGRRFYRNTDNVDIVRTRPRAPLSHRPEAPEKRKGHL